MIANCGQMHLDWHALSLSDYFEALEAHNSAHEPSGVSDDFKEMMRAQFKMN